MDFVILGLTLLANITGFSSGATYQTTTEHLLDALAENGVVSSEEDIEKCVNKTGDIFNLAGQNRYLEIELSNGRWILYDKLKEATINRYKTNPFEGINADTLKLFDEENLGFGYAYYDESANVFESIGNNAFDEESIAAYFAEQGKEAGKYYSDIPLSDDAHVISNYKYFENLKNYHAYNSLGTCTVVAAEILLGYYDTFESDLFVDESYEVIARQNVNGDNIDWTEFSQSPGVDNHLIDDHDFHDYLVGIARDEIHDDPEVDGMTVLSQIGLINNYLNKREIPYSLKTSEGNLADILSQKAVRAIKEGVDDDRPVIANGEKHSVVAYAYDDEYVWVHTGWGWTGATPWKTYESGLFSNYFVGCVEIVYEGNHVHSDNYYSYSQNVYVCPCGVKHSSSSILPEDYGFEEQYFFYSKNHSFSVDELEIDTRRLRCGYIEEEYVNLSPKRKNAGEAYLELHFSKKIRRFSINLSYWQNKDVLSSLDSTAFLEVKRGNEWHYAENLLSLNLSTDRAKQEQFVYSYIGEEIDGIAIRMTSPAVGSRNLGRISIGNLTLIHETTSQP